MPENRRPFYTIVTTELKEEERYPFIEEVVASCARNCRDFVALPENGQTLLLGKMSDIVAEFEVSSRGKWNKSRPDIGIRKAFILDEVRGVKGDKNLGDEGEKKR